jgi:streptogrisin D
MRFKSSTARWRTSLAICGAVTSALALTLGPAAAAPGYTDARLEQVKQALDANPTARIPGTSWGVDPVSRRVLVSYDDTVSGSRMTALRAATDRFGDAVLLEHTPGRYEPASSLTVGAELIENVKAYCSMGFNLRRDDVHFFITAGHCTTGAGDSWRDVDDASLGKLVVYQNGGTGQDWAVAQYWGEGSAALTKYGAVREWDGQWQDIKSAAYPYPYEGICRSGYATQKHCGSVTSTCTTVTYSTGITYNCMTRTTACADHGDSGGPLYDATIALGVFSGGALNCDENPSGPTFYTPIKRILDNYNLSVY